MVKKGSLIFSISMMMVFLSTAICGALTYNVTQLSNTAKDDHTPQISNNGHVVWVVRNDGSNEDGEIYLYDGFSVRNISNNPASDDFEPQINDNGQVVWRGHDGSDTEIFLYDGSSTIQLTDDEYGDSFPKINNNGYVVWQRFDDPDWEIFLYDGTNVTNISNDPSRRDDHPQINDSGHVVWQKYEPSVNAWAYLYDGSSVTNISNSWALYPQINNNGQFA
jgi:serralysin